MRGGSSYRPGMAKRKREHEIDSYRPEPYKRTRRPSPPIDHVDRNPPPPSSDLKSDSKTPTKHTKKERQSNRSSRIHSLRRELSRGHLPRILHQEKERELAGLLLDQQKDKVRETNKKNLEKYHFVRFVEKRKALKRLKKLRNLQQRIATTRGTTTTTSGNNNESEQPNITAEQKKQDEELARQIHEMDVNWHYATYAPLGQKYISVFAEDMTRKPEQKRHENPSRMNKSEFALLDAAQRQELKELTYDVHMVLEGNDRNLDGTGSLKPPMWYEVEAAMALGPEKLEALRDGAGRVLDEESGGLVLGRSGKTAKTPKETPAWLDDDGQIDPADLDSDGDEEMSDGGFFEK